MGVISRPLVSAVESPGVLCLGRHVPTLAKCRDRLVATELRSRDHRVHRDRSRAVARRECAGHTSKDLLMGLRLFPLIAASNLIVRANLLFVLAALARLRSRQNSDRARAGVATAMVLSIVTSPLLVFGLFDLWIKRWQSADVA